MRRHRLHKPTAIGTIRRIGGRTRSRSRSRRSIRPERNAQGVRPARPHLPPGPVDFAQCTTARYACRRGNAPCEWNAEESGLAQIRRAAANPVMVSGVVMPDPTRLLDDGNFVCSPEAPPKPAFSQYLDYADRLLAEWRQVCEDWKRQPLSAALGRQKNELDAAAADFAQTFCARYGLTSVEQDPAFWPVSKFLAERRPVYESFAVLHADRNMPLHTVLDFRTDGALVRLNAALDEDTPLRWWRDGSHDRPCYLFGDCVWELASPEVDMSESGITLLFLEFFEARRQRRDRLIRASSTSATAAVVEFVPQKTRTVVWRRARGKCEKCGGLEGLDFTVVGPPGRGRSDAPHNVQLLCGRCRESEDSSRR